MTDNWRVDSHEREINQLRDDLREVKSKIWALEIRPLEWFSKAVVVIGLMAIAIEIAVAIAHKH